MKKRSTSGELQDLIKQLTTIRKEHVRALDEIENTFRMFGLERLLKDGAGKKRGPKKAAVKAAVKAAPAAPSKKKGGKAKKAAATPTATATKAPKAGKKAKATKAPKATKAAKAPKATKAPKAAKAAKSAGKRRGSFEITGDELILRFVKDKGNATTEQIRKHWEASSRGGKSDNNLTNLVKSGKLVRSKDPSGPGSLYSLPASAAASTAPTTTPTA